MIVTYNTGLGEDPGMSSRLRMEMIKADLLAPKAGMFDPTAIPQTSNPPLNVQATVSTYAGSSADAAAAGGLPDTGMAASAGGLFSTRNLAILAGLGAAYYWFFVREKPKASSPGPVSGLFGRRSRRRRRR